MAGQFSGKKIVSVLLSHFSRQSPRALLTRAYLTILLVSVVDYVTGPELSLLLVYFLPIIIISWYLGKQQGMTTAIAATAATAIHDLLRTDSFAVMAFRDVLPYWLIFQRGALFLIVSVIVAALRASEDDKRHADYRLARQVQSFLIPQTSRSLTGFDCFGFCKSFDHLSGDFFDLVPLGPTKLAIIVGDICGKGISAALLMAYVQGVLRSHGPFSEEKLSALLSTVNRSLHLSTAEDKFATLFIGIYDEKRRTLTYVNAGHDPPTLFRRGVSAHPVRLPETSPHMDSPPGDHIPGTLFDAVKLEPGGLLLGVDPDVQYCTSLLKLQYGDILVCDTDGLKEAMNAEGEMYGPERLASIVISHRERSSREIHGSIMADLDRFIEDKPQFDDMTLVVGKVV